METQLERSALLETYSRLNCILPQPKTNIVFTEIEKRK